MDQELVMALRERAVEALESSTTMLEVAQNLIKQGNEEEADRLRNEARYKRNESILLMDQARTVEQASSNVLHFPPRQSHVVSENRSERLRDEADWQRTG